MGHPRVVAEEREYESVLKKWYQESSVRAKERRILPAEEALSDIYYPPELAPVVLHPLVRAKGETLCRTLLIQHLYLYLDSIELLEHAVVNRVVFALARRQSSIAIPTEMRLDAYKIYTDEAYHMLFSADLIEQIKAQTGIASITRTPPFAHYLAFLEESESPEMRELIVTFLSIITETMISSILCEIPKDKRVVQTVRDLVMDHAIDEGRHNAFFGDLFSRLWPSLSDTQRAHIGPLLPSLIAEFCRPNLEAITAILAAARFSKNEIDQILAESYPTEDLSKSAKQAACGTVRMFQRFGVLEDAKTRDAFLARGLC